MIKETVRWQPVASVRDIVTTTHEVDPLEIFVSGSLSSRPEAIAAPPAPSGMATVMKGACIKHWWGILVLFGALGCGDFRASPPDSGANDGASGSAGAVQAGSGGVGGAAGAPAAGGVGEAGSAGGPAGAPGAVATAPACAGEFDSSASVCSERAGVPPRDFECATGCVVRGVSVTLCIANDATFCVDTCEDCNR
jgi:hypothetical protein